MAATLKNAFVRPSASAYRSVTPSRSPFTFALSWTSKRAEVSRTACIRRREGVHRFVRVSQTPQAKMRHSEASCPGRKCSEKPNVPGLRARSQYSISFHDVATGAAACQDLPLHALRSLARSLGNLPGKPKRFWGTNRVSETKLNPRTGTE